MSLFQKSVEQKYLKELDEKLIDKKYNEFQNYFGNSEIQKNIRYSTEEQFQEGFLINLFENILDYSLNPRENFNIKTEIKNQNSSKKADGAILKEGEVVGIIELKSIITTDLDSIEEQAFGYKNHHPNCTYIITSNFEKIRFYINDAVNYEEFNLFKLTKERFSLLWLCLAKDNLLNDIPLKVKDASVLEEKDVTERLYEDYSKFREEIFNDIVKNNPSIDKLTLFKKTQKLLDRFLFIFFAEDRLLLPPNSISEIIGQWEEQISWGDNITLYDRFKKYFHLLNTGWKGKKYEIFPYNGGLFEEDSLLDNLFIDSELLRHHTKKLSSYNFDPENNNKDIKQSENVDVNILGHIFEHSLNEIETVQAKFKGAEIDQKKTKQKTEGIFYTPKNITKFIIESTIGRLCNEKKRELGIKEQEYVKGRKNRLKKTVKNLDNKLNDYRNWLLSLTILDPACGSGAFLNQALDFLIKEHRKIDELHARLFEDKLTLSDITKDILEKNLYGVDLNEESIEIAKLSLWLKTAKKGRKLHKLNKNIKCGNTLIDNPEVAGDKAFKWQEEFPSVFENGGFDVIIGNPPYVRVQNIDYEVIDWLKNNMKSAYKRIDISILFIEKALKLIKKNDGVISYITSNQFFKAEYGRKVRELILNKLYLNIDLSDVEVFKGLTTYVSILNLSNKYTRTIQYSKVNNLKQLNNLKYINFDYQQFNDNSWDFNPNKSIKDKLYKDCLTLEECANFVYGIITGNDKSFIVDNKDIEGYQIENNILVNFLKPENYVKYSICQKDKFIIYPYTDNNELIDEDTFFKRFPNAYNYLAKNKHILENRKDSRHPIKEKGIPWYSIMRRVSPKKLQTKKIIFYDVGSHPNFILDIENCAFGGGTSHALYLKNHKNFKDYYLLGVLNSNVMTWLIHDICPIKKGGARKFGLDYIKRLPIKISKKQTPLADKAKKREIFTENLYSRRNSFLDLLSDNLEIKKYSKKINEFYNYDFKTFLSELERQKVKLSLSHQREWKEFFNQTKEEINEIQSEITKTDKEIDQMVYKLYGLTEKEIKIVENTT